MAIAASQKERYRKWITLLDEGANSYPIMHDSICQELLVAAHDRLTEILADELLEEFLETPTETDIKPDQKEQTC